MNREMARTVEWHEPWNGEDSGMAWHEPWNGGDSGMARTVEWRGRRNDVDIGALEIFCYEGKHLYYKINLLTSIFFNATSNVSHMQKSNNILYSARIVTRYYFTYSIFFKCNWLEHVHELYNFIYRLSFRLYMAGLLSYRRAIFFFLFFLAGSWFSEGLCLSRG